MMMVQFDSGITKSISILLLGLSLMVGSASADVRQIADPAKNLLPEYRGALDVCPLVIDDGGLGSSMIELEPRRSKVSLASGWNQTVYWDRNEIAFAQLPARLSTAANTKPRPYIILSAIGGDRADYSKMEDIVIKSAFCTSPEAAVGEVASKPIIATPPDPLPTQAVKEPTARSPTQPIPQPSQSGSASNYRPPISPIRVNSGYFDANYPPSQHRQHLGVDLAAAVGAQVRAPISGRVVTNRTDDLDVMQAFLVIRGSDGTEHVLGHIASNLRVGSMVEVGQTVGVVRAWPSCPNCSHIHWGINRSGIAQAMWGSWGWGRAPLTATRAQAAARGWLDPLLGGK